MRSKQVYIYYYRKRPMRSYYKYLVTALCFTQQTLPSLSKKEIISLSKEQIASYYIELEQFETKFTRTIENFQK